MEHPMWWVLFNVFVLIMLLLDLFVFHRKAHEVKVREALAWSAFWIFLAIVFNIGIYIFLGHDLALKFLTGYILEKSLSVDNLFVFLIIFNYFQVPKAYQHTVLFWGIVGALVMRAIFIALGITLLHHFHGIIYIFGAILIYTGIRLFFEKDKEIHPEKNIVLRIFRKFMPVTREFHGPKFFTRETGPFSATPLFIVLLIIETTDVVFAVDSIPAVLAVSQDPFIVYTSNVFAILGLRALYFALAGLMTMFHMLHYGLGTILVFVGVKMMIADIIEIPIGGALGFIAGVLIISVIASITCPQCPNEK